MKHKHNTSRSVVGRVTVGYIMVTSVPPESKNPIIGWHSFIQNMFIEPGVMPRGEDTTMYKTDKVPAFVEHEV